MIARFLFYFVSLLFIYLEVDAGTAHQTVSTHHSIRRIAGPYQMTNEMVQIDRPWVFDNGILFTYNGQIKGIGSITRPLEIYLSGSFFNWQKKIKLLKNQFGVYQVFVQLPLKKRNYSYRFWVNGLWVNDQEQPYRVFDRNGESISSFVLPHDLAITVQKSPQKMGSFQYRFFLRDQGYREVYWVSSLNGWSLQTKPMTKKDGYWWIDQRIEKPELYVFFADNQKKLDPLNREIHQTRFGFRANLVRLIP